MNSYNFSDALSSFAVEAPATEQTSSAFLKRRPRRGHKKSRQGCFNCKRRKIKCQEIHPACPSCIKSKTRCEYPAERQEKGALICPQNAGLEFRNTVPLQSTPTQFSLTDMRLFHHFLTVAYPPVPFGNDQIWISDIAASAHSVRLFFKPPDSRAILLTRRQYDYLIHSILGMAASHLNILSTSGLHADALYHRIQAMRGLNEALSIPPKTAADSDAILATCYALACQTSYICESIEEFLTMLHGCHLVESQGWAASLGTVFALKTTESQREIVRSRLEKVVHMDPNQLEAAEKSLEKLGLLCQTRLEKSIFQNLRNIINCNSARQVCTQSFRSWRDLATLPHEDFEILVDTGNSNMQLLIAHSIAVHTIIYPARSRRCEWADRDIGAFGWKPFPLGNIYANMREDMRKYLEWPMKITGSCVGICN